MITSSSLTSVSPRASIPRLVLCASWLCRDSICRCCEICCALEISATTWNASPACGTPCRPSTSTPVEVLGLQGVPQAGEAFQVVADISKAQQISQHRQMLSRQSQLAQSTKRGIEALGETEVKELLVIIKADVQGSVEVLKSTLQKLSTERVKVKVIRSGVGAITESDVLLASATQASASSSAVVIIGFNVRPESRA